MAHAGRQPPTAKRGKKAKKQRSARPAPIEDVVTFPVPRKRLFASFPGELRFDRARRRTPHVVFEPEDEGPIEDVVVLDIPRNVRVGPFPIEIPLDGIARRKPHIVFEPESEED